MTARLVVKKGLTDADELLQQLTMRLIGGEQSTTEAYPKVYVGALPDEMPARLPVPNRTRIIGTAVRSPESLKVYAQVESRPEQVISFYESRLPSHGWEDSSSNRSLNGFVRASRRDRKSARFTHSGLGSDLYLNAWAPDEGISEFVLRLEPEDQSQLDPQIEAARQLQADMGSLLPALAPPTGTWKSGGGASGGMDHRSSDVVLETGMSANDLMKHFASQLKKSNWNQLGTLDRGRTLISYWEFEDTNGNPCLGFLDVTQPDGQPELRHVHILASRFGAPGDHAPRVA